MTFNRIDDENVENAQGEILLSCKEKGKYDVFTI